MPGPLEIAHAVFVENHFANRQVSTRQRCQRQHFSHENCENPSHTTSLEKVSCGGMPPAALPFHHDAFQAVDGQSCYNQTDMSGSMPGKVLVVDDDPPLLRTMGVFL